YPVDMTFSVIVECEDGYIIKTDYGHNGYVYKKNAREIKW
ncbi:hypothetical protein LCGC14_1783710, partial [marine sediment metagenome]